MKKSVSILTLVCLCVLVVIVAMTVDHSAAQDLVATKNALELEIQILQMQATLEAMKNGTGTGATPPPAQPQPTSTLSPDEISGGMMNWSRQNSAHYSTGTPFNTQNMVTMQNFPTTVRPRIPDDTPPTWNQPYVSRRVEMTVGTCGQYPNLETALKNIPKKAGEVVIYMTSDTLEPPDGFGIPVDREIKFVRIQSNNGTTRYARPSGRSFWFFCNGIPLIIGSDVVFEEKSMVMGGSVTYDRHNVHHPESTIIVNGRAWWVYAGGQSSRKDHSSSVDRAFVIINGWVDRVYAGGRAIYGDTIVNYSKVVVNGTAEEIYCSGYTENPAATTTVGKADMMIYGWYSNYALGKGPGEIRLLDPSGCY